jgi:hypothetical protein
MLITLYGPLYVPSSIRYRYHDRSEAESRSLKRRVSEERNCYLKYDSKKLCLIKIIKIYGSSLTMGTLVPGLLVLKALTNIFLKPQQKTSCVVDPE